MSTLPREGVEPLGFDAPVRVAATKPVPAFAVDVAVVVAQRLLLGGIEVELDGPAVDDEPELLAVGDRAAHRRAGADVAGAQRVGRRAEVERAAEEQPVDRADARPALRRDGAEVQDLDAAQPRCELGGVDAPVLAEDAQEVRAGACARAVEQALQPDEVLRGLVHPRRTAPRPAGPATRSSVCGNGGRSNVSTPRCRGAWARRRATAPPRAGAYGSPSSSARVRSAPARR